VAVDREEERDRDLRDGVRVAARRVEYGDTGLGRGRDVDVVGVAAARTDDAQVAVEHGTVHEVGLDDEDVGAFLLDAGRELLAVVEAERHLLDPRVVHDIGERLQRLHALTAKRCGDERRRSSSGHRSHPRA
jgi:hypothetical protein